MDECFEVGFERAFEGKRSKHGGRKKGFQSMNYWKENFGVLFFVLDHFIELVKKGSV